MSFLFAIFDAVGAMNGRKSGRVCLNKKQNGPMEMIHGAAMVVAGLFRQGSVSGLGDFESAEFVIMSFRQGE